MNRREFIKITGLGITATAIPGVLTSYHGNCKARDSYCMGRDSQPLSYKNREPHGPVLCEYHGALVSKLKLLTLCHIEYLCKHLSTGIKNDVMKVIDYRDTIKIKLDHRWHDIRVTAMNCSNEYFIKHHREIFGCA